MDKALLSVIDLKTYFDTDDGIVRAVDGVSFDIYQGETLAVVGESGSGKSVTALSVMGLIEGKTGKITGGQIIFEGRDLVKLKESEMIKVRGKEISMIFQEPMTSLNPVMTVGSQIAEVLALHEQLSKKEAWPRVIKLLDLVGIPSPGQRAAEYPHQLSGGMRQRVMIAMALACSPKLLIADEPTTALDVTIEAQILELINKIKEKTSASVLLITHDLGVVAEIAQRVLVMYAGQVVEQSEVNELFKKPLHPYTMGLIGSMPDVHEDVPRLKTIEGIVPSQFNMPEGCYFNPRCPYCRDICKREMPQLFERSGRRVRCHMYNPACEKGAE